MDVLAELLALQAKQDAEPAAVERGVVFVGEPGSGKTSLLRALAPRRPGGEQHGDSGSTTALSYSHARAEAGDGDGAVGGAEQLTHYWELGGGRRMDKLLEIAVTSQSVDRSLAVVVLDLSQPHTVAESLAYWVKRVRAHAASCLNKRAKTEPGAQAAAKARAEAAWEGHADRARVGPSLVPLLIVAAKYDAFESSDAGLLRVMARTLRCVAHSCGASLVYASSRSTGAFRAMAQRRLAGGGALPDAPRAVDDTRALVVPAGSDSFSDIGAPPSDGAAAAPAGKTPSPAQQWIKACRRHFPAPRGAAARPAEEGARPHLEPEPVVDAAVAQREQEYERVRREVQLRRKLELAGTGPAAGAASASAAR